MAITRVGAVLLAVVSMGMLQGASEGGCGEGLDNRAGEPGVDVGGKEGAVWDMTYSDTLEVVVKNAGAIVATNQFVVGAGGVLDLDGTEVDLNELCQREDVACPEEIFPYIVTMTQPGDNLHLLGVEFNKEGPLGELDQTTLLGNVDSDFDFSIALSVGAAAVGTCGLLKVSYATGHIDDDGGDPPLGTSLSGEIVTAYSGGCMLIGNAGAAGAGLTVEFHLPFSGVRRK